MNIDSNMQARQMWTMILISGQKTKKKKKHCNVVVVVVLRFYCYFVISACADAASGRVHWPALMAVRGSGATKVALDPS